MTVLDQRFKPPKSNSKEWEVVKFLSENGFKYQKVFLVGQDGGSYSIEYPKNLQEAKEFVLKYKNQALNN